MESKIFAIPKEIMIGTGNALFDHIAECLVEFVVENELTDRLLLFENVVCITVKCK